MLIYCCGCNEEIEARLTNGGEIYPHRPDLKSLPFWKCDSCGNHVGCHYKTKNKIQPLGCIPTPEIRNARVHIHKLLDPLWKTGKISRKDLYKKLSNEFGWNYHTANIRSVEEARKVYRFMQRWRKRRRNE